jgi:hypothetical protein
VRAIGKVGASRCLCDETRSQPVACSSAFMPREQHGQHDFLFSSNYRAPIPPRKVMVITA